MDPVPEDFDRAMFVVAHPDDIEYGLAGVAARWTSQGKEVVYVLATSGEAGIDTIDPAASGLLREQEERTGAAEVGVTTVEFLGFPDGVLEPSVDLRRAIARQIRIHRPDLVACASVDVRAPWGGVDHADHRAVGLATIDAIRDAGNRWVFPELRDDGLEPWKVRTTMISASAHPTHGIDLTGFLEPAIRSLEAHRVYLDVLGGDFDPRTFLTGAAEAGGRAIGTEHGMTVELIG